jgi:hypothetical protein
MTASLAASAVWWKEQIEGELDGSACLAGK